MFGGGGGMDPRKMKQMMEQMGVDIEELDAEEVVIRTSDKEYVFSDAEVQRMDAQGQATYTIVGEPDVTGAEGGAVEEEADTDDAESADDDGPPGGVADFSEGDVELVQTRTGVSEDDAREALEAENGDLAAAIKRLE